MRTRIAQVVGSMIMVCLATGFARADLSEGLVAYWTFDECDATDETGTGFDGTLFGNPSCEDGVLGKALFIDPQDDYIKFPGALSPRDIRALSFLIKSKGPNASNRRGTVMAKYNWHGERSFRVESYDGDTSRITVKFYARGDSYDGDGVSSYYEDPGSLDPSKYTVVNNTLLETDTWKHVVVNITDAEVEIWIDGTLTNKVKRDYSAYHDSGEPVYMGNIFNAGPDYNFNYRLNGTLDEFRVYDRPLSEAEIQELSNLSVSITTTPAHTIKLGELFSLQLEAVYGAPPYSWTISGGVLPGGMEVSPDGVLSGTPTEAGEFTFTVRVTDSDDNFAEKELTLEVLVTLPPPRLSLLVNGTTAVPGRNLSYFAILRNLGTTVVEGVTLYGFLEPWLTLDSATPVPTATLLADDTFPSDAGGDYEAVIEWGPLTLAPGEAIVVAYTTQLDPTFPLPATADLHQAFPSSNGYVTQVVCSDKGGDDGPSDCVAECFQENYPGLPTDYWTTFCADVIAEFCRCICDGGTENQCNYTNWFCEEVTYEPKQDRSRLFFGGGASASSVGEGKCEIRREPASRPVDPNEKLVVADGFIQPDDRIFYFIQPDQRIFVPIHFENIGNAEALDVFVTDVLHTNLDSSTLEILSPGGTYDPTSRTLRWELIGRNLQPGEADNVLLSIKPVPGLPSGTEIPNSAEIQFEVFDPLVTPEVVSIIDSTPPTCVMDPLPAVTATPEFSISWSGADAIGEIESYSLFVSENGGSFTPFLTKTAATSATFSGTPGHTYGFICIAADTAGNVEVQDPVAETITRVVTGPGVDNFMSYRVKRNRDGARFSKFGPVRLADQFGSEKYEVAKPRLLLLPADKNDEGTLDEVTHLREYQIKPIRGAAKFSRIKDVRIVNQCSDVLLEVKSPYSLLVPTNKSLTDNVDPPNTTDQALDHYLCYQVKQQKRLADGTRLPKFPVGMQVVVEDQFQRRRYDLKGITKLCNPVAKDEDPSTPSIILRGQGRGTPFPIEPASIRNGEAHLLCYRAKPAKRLIPQDGCGCDRAVDPSCKGVKLEPRQKRHEKRTGIHVNNQFGPELLNTLNEMELCIASWKNPVPPTSTTTSTTSTTTSSTSTTTSSTVP